MLQLNRKARLSACGTHRQAKDAKTCKGFLESPLRAYRKELAEPIRCNGMTQLVFAFLAILA